MVEDTITDSPRFITNTKGSVGDPEVIGVAKQDGDAVAFSAIEMVEQVLGPNTKTCQREASADR